MLNLAAFGTVGCGAALWLLFAGESRKQARRSGAAAGESVRWPWLAAGSAAFAAGLAFGPSAAGLAGAIAGICSWCAACVVREPAPGAVSGVGRTVRRDSGQSGTGLAHGRGCAGDLGAAGFWSDCPHCIESGRRVPQRGRGKRRHSVSPTAPTTRVGAWLADVVAVAAASGGQWVPILGALESEAAEAAATARHFHRHVAANLPHARARCGSRRRGRRGQCAGESRCLGLDDRPARPASRARRRRGRSGHQRPPSRRLLGDAAMSGSVPTTATLALWAAAALGASAAVHVLVAGEKRRRTRRRLAAVGWSPPRLAMLTVIVAVATIGIGLVVGNRMAGGGAVPSRSVLAWVAARGPSWRRGRSRGLMASAVLSGQRRRLDGAVLLWLRRIRLFVGSRTAHQRGRARCRRACRRPRLRTGGGRRQRRGHRRPRPARRRRGPVVRFANGVACCAPSTQRSDQAPPHPQLLDRVLDRVVRAIDDRRREQIDRLGRSVGASASLLAVVASAVVMVTVVMTLPTV